MANLFKPLLSRLFELSRWKKRLLLIVFDTFSIPLAFFLSLAINIDTSDYLNDTRVYVSCFLVSLALVATFYIRRLYSAFTRHFSFDAFVTISFGIINSAITFTLCAFAYNFPTKLPIILIYVAISIIFITGLRLGIRLINESLNNKNRQNVAVYGAGAAGTHLMNALNASAGYRVCQLIDDDTSLHNQTIGGIKIESFDNAKKKLASSNIRTLFLALPSDSEAVRQKILNLPTDYPLVVKAIPDISGLIEGSAAVAKMKEVNIEDLLGRAPAKPNILLMSEAIAGKTILVSGAGGSIGGELSKQIAEYRPANLILLDSSEAALFTLLVKLELQNSKNSVQLTPVIGSIQDTQLLRKVFKRFAIDTVYHAAAYKHVPLMEQNVMQCIANNVFGTQNLANVAAKSGVKNFILISTDKAVNPTNYMGASKRLAEAVCQCGADLYPETKFSIVRFGNVLGSSGSVVPLFKRQIEQGGPVTLTSKEITRYFMTIPEAAQLVIQAGAFESRGAIFVLDMGEPVKILNLAEKMITLFGKKPTLSAEAADGGSILIKCVGLRPGEKLFEELSYTNRLVATTHPRILLTNEKPFSQRELMAILSGLHRAIKEDNQAKLFDIIKGFSAGVCDMAVSEDLYIEPNYNQEKHRKGRNKKRL